MWVCSQYRESVAVAQQSIEYLGTNPASTTMKLKLKISKLEDIKKLCSDAAKLKEISLRTLSKILGNLAWAINAVPYAQSHYRALQTVYNQFYHQLNLDMEFSITLDKLAIDDLLWWRDNVLSCSGKSLDDLKPDLIIYSDASLKGWGATMNGAAASGPWGLDESVRHINELELLAAFYALRSFASFASNVSIHLMLDNATAVAYINKCGGTRSESLRVLALELIRWCEIRHISIQAFHIPGLTNSIADYHSRFFSDSSDWMLDPEIFAKIQRIWPAKVDLFASIWNKQLDLFVSWKPQPDNLAVDALSLNWRWIRGYLFPPFCLISRCLTKIRRDNAVVTLVTPLWPSQPWFPLVLELTCDKPRILPQGKRLLVDPNLKPHPLLEQKSFRLVAWRLSGIDWQRKIFHQTCQICCLTEIERTRIKLMTQHGEYGYVGITNDRLIPFVQL